MDGDLKVAGDQLSGGVHRVLRGSVGCGLDLGQGPVDGVSGVFEKVVGLGDELQGAFAAAACVGAEAVDRGFGEAVDLGAVAVSVFLRPGREGGQRVVAVCEDRPVGVDAHLQGFGGELLGGVLLSCTYCETF